MTKGGERVLFGESAIRRRNYGAGTGPRITYNNPIDRGYRSTAYASPRHAPPVSPEPRGARHNQNNYILTTREEAEMVLERMIDIIDNYDVVSVAELNILVGEQGSHVDNKWGWIYLTDVQIRQVREGFLIDFPPAEPIQ